MPKIFGQIVTAHEILTVRREPRWRVLGIRIGTKGYTVAVRHTCPHVVTQDILFVRR